MLLKAHKRFWVDRRRRDQQCYNSIVKISRNTIQKKYISKSIFLISKVLALVGYYNTNTAYNLLFFLCCSILPASLFFFFFFFQLGEAIKIPKSKRNLLCGLFLFLCILCLAVCTKLLIVMEYFRIWIKTRCAELLMDFKILYTQITNQ